MSQKLRFLITLLLLNLASLEALDAQTFVMNGNPINACSGVFTDSGGLNGDYSPNQNITTTICSNSMGITATHVQLTFSNVDIREGDVLTVYDGPSVAAGTLLGTHADFNGDPVFIFQASSANTSGCLTLVFTSDGSDEGTGWRATMNCVRSCQQIFADLASSTPAVEPAENGWIDACPGTRIFLNGQGIYPQNGLIYQHSDFTSSFSWDFGDGGTAVGPTVSHIYDEPGGYTIQLTITDQLGCKNINFIGQRVRIAPRPRFNIAGDIPSEVCAQDTLTLSAIVNDSSSVYEMSVLPGVSTFSTGGIVADSLPLPDGNGVCYTSAIEINSFSPGQTLQSIDDLEGVCVVMEHSFLHDLEISITCPSGVRVITHNFISPPSTGGAGATLLGVPNDPDNPPGSIQPGIGWEYCWSADATQGTWRQYATNFNPGTMPAGDYNSFQSLNSLIGCPLNGAWTLEVCDRWAIDNGFIFEWSINFAPEIFPELETFSPSILDYSWQNNPTVTYFSPDSIQAVPQNAGTAAYNFTVTDEFGCVWDSLVNVQVLPPTHPDCSSCEDVYNDQEDVEICQGQSAPLDVRIVDSTLLRRAVTFESFPQAPFGFRLHGPSNPFTNSINVNSIRPLTLTQPTLQIERVCVDISTNWNSDLVLSLRAPNGSLLELSSNNGGASDHYRNTCFTPTAPTSIIAGTGPFTGDYRPEGNWSNLSGPINGEWRLIAVDQFGINDVGEVHSWSITFNSVNTISYLWTPAVGLSCSNCPTPIASPSQPISYRVLISDAYGCSLTDTINVVPLNQLPTPSVSCAASDNGGILFSWPSIPGVTEYEYQLIIDGQPTAWTGPLAAQSFAAEGYPANTVIEIRVRMYVSGNALCQPPIGSASCTVDGCPPSLPPLVIDTIFVSPVLCHSGNTGSATVVVTGGTAPYNYRWSHSLAQITPTATFLEAGTYEVTVSDVNTCFTVGTVVVTEPDTLLIQLQGSPVSCRSGSDGSATATVTGGVGPYQYQWSNQGQGAAISQLPAGNYQLSVTDANGCFQLGSINISQPATAVDVVATQSFAGCDGSASNQALATGSGGTGSNYQYNWSNGQIGGSASPLAPGIYSVTVTDQNGCTDTSSVVVSDLAPLTFSILAESPNCNNYSDGTLSVTQIMGGAGQQLSDYSFEWSNGGNGIAIFDLPGGFSYSVTVTDQQGCRGTGTRTLTNPDPITIALASAPTSCYGSADGTATITAINGPNDTYTYLWDSNTGGQTGISATGLAAGTYSVIVTDNRNCRTTGAVVVGQPSEIVASFSVKDNGCYGEAEGSVATVVSGGAGNYTYSWPDSSQQANISGLAAGLYELTITDGNGCQLVKRVAVGQPEQLQLLATVNPVRCHGDRNGSIVLSTSGGTAPFRYSLDGQQFIGSNTLIGLAAGTYGITVRDAEGCQNFAFANVTEPAPFSIDAGPDIWIVYGDSIPLVATVQNGIQPIEWNWYSSFPGTLSCGDCASPYAAPTYTIDYEVLAVDANGCESSDLLRVIVEKIRLVTVPTGFTPNGDGENDLLLVHGRPGSTILSFQLFDRWGEQMWEAKDFGINDPNIGWDGRFRGQDVNGGVYLWIVRVRYEDGEEEVLRGQTTLIR